MNPLECLAQLLARSTSSVISTALKGCISQGFTREAEINGCACIYLKDKSLDNEALAHMVVGAGWASPKSTGQAIRKRLWKHSDTS
jgi:hypothetical protein